MERSVNLDAGKLVAFLGQPKPSLRELLQNLNEFAGAGDDDPSPTFIGNRAGEEYYCFFSLGITFALDDNSLRGIFLYGGHGEDPFTEGVREPFRGRLPFGICFTDTRASVMQKLGEPLERGLGGLSTCDRYRFENYIMDIEYDSNGLRVLLVVLWSLE